MTMGSFSTPQRWASWLEGPRWQRWQAEGSGGTAFLVQEQESGFQSPLFQLCDCGGQVTFLRLSLFIWKPHLFIH